jgi:hypothetical protein
MPISALAKTAIPTASGPVCWRLSRSAEAVASVGASAGCYRSTEDVLVIPVVVPELELRDVERQVFPADLVVRADHAALEQRPEAFNRVGVDCADHVLLGGVVDGLVREGFAKPVVGGELILSITRATTLPFREPAPMIGCFLVARP